MSNPPSNDNQAARSKGTALGSASFFIGLFLIVALPFWFFIELAAAFSASPPYTSWAFITEVFFFLLSVSGVWLGVAGVRKETQSKAFAITGIVINSLALVFYIVWLLSWWIA